MGINKLKKYKTFAKKYSCKDRSRPSGSNFTNTPPPALVFYSMFVYLRYIPLLE